MIVNLKLKRMAKQLNDAVTNEDRVVTYHAISMFTAKVLINAASKNESVAKDININSAVLIEKFTAMYAEVGVVDCQLFKNILRNTMKFLIPSDTSKDNYFLETINVNCFEDAVGITQYFSKDTIDLINKKINIYKETAYACTDVTESLKSVIHGD